MQKKKDVLCLGFRLTQTLYKGFDCTVYCITKYVHLSYFKYL